MSSSEFARSEAMMEGTRLLMESLREKVATLEDKCERLDREKLALSDLLVAKKSDYHRMKDHCNQTICDLEDEVQRLKSEKARLLDRLQLPESERASLAAEENEIAELKRRLEDYEIRYGDAVTENEDLRQEVRDLQLAMGELHDQFRDEETVELRDLQRELEATAKACRIAQFKLRKAERRCELLEQDRQQTDEKLRSLENCLQGSDDKRRLRLLEDDLRKAKEAAVRLHDDAQRAEERRQRHQDDLDRVKNLLNESENRRLIVENEMDKSKLELQKLREQLKCDGRIDLLKATNVGLSVGSTAELTQLSRDLAASEERENDLREQLKFAEQEIKTIRKKLSETEDEVEGMSLQLRKLTSAKRSSPISKPGSEADSAELRLHMELAEQEVTVLKRKLDVAQSDNENLLTAVKYLRAKVEGNSPKELISSVIIVDGVQLETFRRKEQELLVELEAAKQKIAEVTLTLQQQIAEAAQSTETQVVKKDQDTSGDELEKKKTEVKKSKEDGKTTGKDGKPKAETSKKQLDELKKQHEILQTELKQCQDALKSSETTKESLESVQKTYSELKESYDKLVKETKEKDTKTSVGIGSKEKEPPSWRWDKQEFERQIKELKKKNDELMATSASADGKKPTSKVAKLTSETKNEAATDSGECGKCCAEKTELRKQLEQIQQELAKTTKEHDASDKKGDVVKAKDGIVSKMKGALAGSSETNTKTIQDLTAQLDKKEAEVKAKVAEIAKAEERIEELQRQLDKATSDSKKEGTEKKTKLKTEIKRLEQELESAKLSGNKEESNTSALDKERLVVEKQNLASEVDKLKKSLADVEKQAKVDKEELEKLCKKKTKLVDKLQAEVEGLKVGAKKEESNTSALDKERLVGEVDKLKTSLASVEKQAKVEKEELEKLCKKKTKLVDKLQAEVDGLKAQVNEMNSKSTPSSVDIPIQHEKSKARTIPVQKINGTSSKSKSSSASDQESGTSDETFRTGEQAHLEEKVQTLEEQAARTQEQLAIAYKELESAAQASKTALEEVRSRYNDELEAWKKDHQRMKKTETQVEEFRSRISVLDKSVEDLTSKLKAEEAKRREAENKARLHSDNKASTATVEEKPASPVMSQTSAKLSDFRSKFEKFGGVAASSSPVKPGNTPAPVRRLSASATTSGADQSGATSNTAGDSALSELQRQVVQLDKSNAKERQELLEKIALQKKDFDAELQELRKRNNELNARSEELASVRKSIIDLQCQLDEERAEKARLQLQTAMLKSDVVASSTASGDETKPTSQSLVIPIRRVDTTSDDSPTSPPAVAAGGDDVKTRRSLFKPVPVTPSKSSSTSRTIPITKLGGRPPTPRF